jgi:hypothetical protein
MVVPLFPYRSSWGGAETALPYLTVAYHVIRTYESQMLCFWILSIVLSLSKNSVLFIFEKNTTFRRLDSVSVFRQNLLS